MAINPTKWADQSREFLGEVQVEFKKVTWPTQKETVAGTVSVVVVVAIVAVALGLVDYALSSLMTLVLP
jgi:preprotein translocase subunit SecE